MMLCGCCGWHGPEALKLQEALRELCNQSLPPLVMVKVFPVMSSIAHENESRL